MLALIKSIPSKDLVVLGKVYRVYEPVTLSSDHLRVCFESKTYRQYVSATSCVQLAVDEINRYVEKHYTGNRFRKAKEDTKATFSRNSKGYVSVSYSYNCPKDLYAKIGKIQVGHISKIDRRDIDRVLDQAGAIRLKSNQEYNAVLLALRMGYRSRVEKEISERDSKTNSTN